MPTHSRGRPKDPKLQQQRKDALLDATLELLTTKSYRSITIREIAEKANMKSAMVSYYFEGKEGLIIGLIDRVSRYSINHVEQAVAHETPMLEVIKTVLRFMVKNRSITRLISDEIIHKEGPLRDYFMAAIPHKTSTVFKHLISQMQADGTVRNDLNLQWAAFNLWSLLATPILISPIFESAWNISFEEVQSDAWAENIYHLFMKGIECKNISMA